ncbi:MAG: glucosaminidase domain-containing protein [Bacteroidetes bacterium]|nr:glucosaminidase domain-containing protein [Bacteroidota bacterium]
MKSFFITGLFLLGAILSGAQTLQTPEQYVAIYKDLAIKEMKRVGVPAAITLAQGLLETENGNSELVKKSNNHFGIKCKSNWTGESVTHDDDAAGECFRSYKTAEDSYRDHSDFLYNSPRYSFLFKLDVTDYKGWAYGLKKAGYATNPNYPQILIKNIEQYNLQQYTLEAAGEAPATSLSDSAVKPGDVKVEPSDLPAVSENILVINGSKCVFAGKGTSVLAIATKNNIALSKLLSFNEQLEDGILQKNQFVYLEKKSKTGDKDFYIAKGGETLYDIAQKNGMQLQPMLDDNKLWGNEEIAAGTRIYLKPGLFNAKPTIETPATTVPKTHIVEAKEGLYGIAKKYGVTVQQLREWNNLKTDALKIGQELIISK